MKIQKLLLPCYVTLLICGSCNSKKTCKYQEEYDSAAAELETQLQQAPNQDQTGGTYGSDYFSDMTHLSCTDFQREYKLSDEQLLQKIEDVERATNRLK